MRLAEIARRAGGASRRTAAVPRGLTRRENEVLHWIAEGKTNGAIAAILGLSAHTVKGYVEQILEKLGVENRTCAARIAFEARNQPPPFGGYPTTTEGVNVGTCAETKL